jgi:hypothetical protein
MSVAIPSTSLAVGSRRSAEPRLITQAGKAAQALGAIGQDGHQGLPSTPPDLVAVAS